MKTTCTCPDFVEWQHKCKHIYAVETVARRELATAAPLPENQELVVPERKSYRQNWPAYRQAQAEEPELFKILLRQLCEPLTMPGKGVGRPRIPVSDLIFAAALKVYSTKSVGRFVKEIEIAKEQGFVSHIMSRNSILRFFDTDEAESFLVQLIEEASYPLIEVETDFAVDSTGFSVSKFVKWSDEKLKNTRVGREWVKAHIMTGVRTNVITSVEIRNRNAGDAPLFSPLVATTAKRFQIDSITADKAYSTVKNLKAAEAAGATPYIPFRSNAISAKGGIWEKMLAFYKLNREEFLKHYHKRSNVESTFAMIKAKFGSNVRSRTERAMRSEVLCKFLCHNICCLISSQFELGIEPEFWKQQGASNEPAAMA